MKILSDYSPLIGLRMLQLLCIYGVLCFLTLCEFDFWPLKVCSITKCCLQFTSIFCSILAISPADPFLKGFSRIDSSKGSRGSLYSPTNKHHCDHSLIVRFWKFYHFCCWLFPISFCDFMTGFPPFWPFFHHYSKFLAISAIFLPL